VACKIFDELTDYGGYHRIQFAVRDEFSQTATAQV